MKTCHPEDERAYLKGVIHSLEAEGDIAELGVYEGFTSKALKDAFPDREVHLFDTFLGILGEQSEENWKAGDYRCYLEDVKKNIGEDFTYHVGDIVGTKLSVKDKKFAFIHVDIDVYAALTGTLEFFYKRLSPGGVMLISNYDDAHPGVQLAVDEFIKPTKRYSRYVFIKNERNN